jgi:hypothetical protein
MAFAAAFARPASSRFIRPGSASLWFPPRPFPASRWLAEHRPTSAATPRQPTTLQQAPKAALPRLDMELRWLFCRSTPAPDEDFFVALRIELGRRAWSLEHAIGAPRPAWSAAPGDESDLEKRRARLVTEVNLGLAIVESASVRYPRLVRNVLLVRHASHIGRCLRDLLAHPGAGSLAGVLQRMLDALQRRQ